MELGKREAYGTSVCRMRELMNWGKVDGKWGWRNRELTDMLMLVMSCWSQAGAGDLVDTPV